MPEGTTRPTSEPEAGGDGKLAILIVDDDSDFRRTCELLVASFGHLVEASSSAEEALEFLGERPFDVVLLDILMPETSGLHALHEMRSGFPETQVVMMSGHTSVPWTVEAIRGGAADFLVKPFDAEALRRSLAIAARTGGLVRENSRLRRALDDPVGTPLIGRSRAMTSLRRMVRKVASSDVSVLITGESGTGKEVVAHAIHWASARRNKPFAPVDCASIVRGLIESELFGHVKGAFTGADRDREGLVGSADGGTLFLDEIGEMPPEVQVRLLRVLEGGEFRPVGSTETRRADVRIIAATNRDLENEESFRRDLFYRLDVVSIKVPALAERREDIPLLAEHFLGRHRRAGSTCERFSARAMGALESYSWPGNVRELENSVERCCVLASGLVIEPDDLPKEVASARGGRGPLRTLKEVRREAIEKTLEAVDYDRTKAAKVLGVDRSTLYRNMREFGMEGPKWAGKRKGKAKGAGRTTRPTLRLRDLDGR